VGETFECASLLLISDQKQASRCCQKEITIVKLMSTKAVKKHAEEIIQGFVHGSLLSWDWLRRSDNQNLGSLFAYTYTYKQNNSFFNTKNKNFNLKFIKFLFFEPRQVIILRKNY
jgi:hypothetical protein